MWATVISRCSVLWLCSDRSFDKAGYSLCFGAPLGLTMVIKPSTFLITLLVMGGSWFSAALRACLTGKCGWPRVLLSAILILGSASAIAGWLWI